MDISNYILDKDNKEILSAYDLIIQTNESFFLTGRAGTGKTTFLKYVSEKAGKNIVTLAPTGMAAILVGGTTIHSFFGFDFKKPSPRAEANSRKLADIKHIDTFIIDEVSMVRCDLIDAIDYNLRRATGSNAPFGGKQVVFTGDLFQLPPVLRSSETSEVEMMQTEYGTVEGFFFRAHAFKHMQLPCIELKKVYRQSDNDFVDILNQIRVGKISDEGLFKLNQRVQKPTVKDEPYVILSGLNARVDKINKQRLSEIRTDSVIYKGSSDGEFKPSEFPVDEELELKVGAQVMFCRNDNTNKRWVNGSLGTVKELNKDEIIVTLENGDDVSVSEVTWFKTKSNYNKETRQMETENVGSFTQYPLRLAWAISIHKSQGATFQRMQLDLTNRSIFQSGQLYVALSRVQSMDGLFLTNPINRYNVFANVEVIDFSKRYNDYSIIEENLKFGKLLFPYQKKGDIDSVAATCLNYAMSIIENGGDQSLVYRYISCALRDVICDDCLFGLTEGKDYVEGSIYSNYINAVIALYSNRLEDAIDYAQKDLMHAKNNDMWYVMAMAYDKLGKHEESDNAYNNMDLTSVRDFKIEYQGAIHNEFYTSDPGLGVAHRLIKSKFTYLPAMRMFRNLLLRKNRLLSLDADESNSIALSFNDPNISDDEFIEQFSSCEDITIKNDFKYIVLRQLI